MKVLTGKNSEYYTNKCIADVIECILKSMLVGSDIEVEVGTFDNCREYGNTYRVIDALQDYTFCVYEHRNSDQIIINGCKSDEIKPYGPYSGESKYDFYASFGYGEHYNATKKLYEMMLECFEGKFKDKFKS